jgi:hypothetical protein
MNLIIDQNRVLKSIQEDFQLHFPYLMIEFYSQTHLQGEGSPKKYQLKNTLTIAQAQNHQKDGIIHISPDMKVSNLENIFEDIFGLHIQILRQSGKIWLQTITTDHLTLSEQNIMGLEMSLPIENKSEIQDYHEQL